MPFAKLDNLRLYYEDHGPTDTDAAPSTPGVLIFLHGFTLDHRMWSAQVPCFEKTHRVIVPDARGHGFSDAPETGYSRAHRVDDLRRLVDSLNLSRFHLVGLSMGGSTAIGYALKHQERLSSLTLASTGAAGFQVGKKISRIDDIARQHGVRQAKQKWREITLSWYGHDKQNIKNLMQIMMDEHSGAIWRDPMRGRYPKEDDLERVRHITVPTLIVAGQADSIFVPLAKLLHQRMPGSELRVFPGAGHMVNLEEPKLFNRELKQFVAGVDAT